jgi:hypothetical protein
MATTKGNAAAAPGQTRHVLTSLRSAVNGPGRRAIDRRTARGKAFHRWRRALIEHLGGQGFVSPQQLAMVDLAATTKLLVDSVDAWLLKQPSLIDRRRRSLLPIVRQRQQLATALAKYMTALGLHGRDQSSVTRQDPPSAGCDTDMAQSGRDNANGDGPEDPSEIREDSDGDRQEDRRT